MHLPAARQATIARGGARRSLPPYSQLPSSPFTKLKRACLSVRHVTRASNPLLHRRPPAPLPLAPPPLDLLHVNLALQLLPDLAPPLSSRPARVLAKQCNSRITQGEEGDSPRQAGALLGPRSSSHSCASGALPQFTTWRCVSSSAAGSSRSLPRSQALLWEAPGGSDASVQRVGPLAPYPACAQAVGSVGRGCWGASPLADYSQKFCGLLPVAGDFRLRLHRPCLPLRQPRGC